MKNFEGLLKSEIKKAERLATKCNRTITKMTGCHYCMSDADEYGFIDVSCEMCSNDMKTRERDVVVHVCLFDRRKSFVTTA